MSTTSSLHVKTQREELIEITARVLGYTVKAYNHSTFGPEWWVADPDGVEFAFRNEPIELGCEEVEEHMCRKYRIFL